jgi:hypothetical protein
VEQQQLPLVAAADLNTEADCEGLAPSGRRCAWRAFHVNIDNIEAALNFTVQTG